ncbi:MAG: MlaD family protein [Bacteroidales bacterium]|jgi:phospholipid/cholesterol/gamma-HCH transport system substrate-binding protein|nr:MlaD family protein [Bacteroidales bacterium]
MDTNSQKFKIRLGMFVTGGFLLFFMAIFIIGKQQNLFNPVFKLTTTFHSVSGLQVGNNIRFAGINVGTVDNITIINDTTVGVDMLIRKEIHKFIKADCVVNIGSEGIIGDRLLIITQGGIYTNIAKEGQRITSNEPVEMDGIMSSLQITADNAAVISDQLAQIMIKVNSGSGTLGRLIRDSTIAANISETIVNLKKSSKGLDENMSAAKENFLLKGYFNKKERAAEKAKKEAEKSIEKEKK